MSYVYGSSGIHIYIWGETKLNCKSQFGPFYSNKLQAPYLEKDNSLLCRTEPSKSTKTEANKN